jgi:hypothetical protein
MNYACFPDQDQYSIIWRYGMPRQLRAAYCFDAHRHSYPTDANLRCSKLYKSYNLILGEHDDVIIKARERPRQARKDRKYCGRTDFLSSLRPAHT